ncbi:unnamed protein product [Kuraishia capsulata CBS 1993]|uniref:dolichyl-phosphate beta-glucosyltransferase n=1 Tax=Kuraishia capsulata CBS 1993 TaxID=1382522 RepID=W6MVJ4_9ASCO|nr:uncharacterized protein KUCA_T00002306001 [Kuraishia capsulata CBS 1993]CDK26335.1 unnamed protein product [Kuraishia capsulata CBS 1993]
MLFHVGIILLVLAVLAYITVYLLSHTPRKIFDSETKFYASYDETEPLHALPPKNSAATDGIKISLVVPCYNETQRLKLMLDEAVSYLKSKYPDAYEIVLVDDGSKDGTAEYALKLASKTYGLKPGVLRVVKFVKNRGKGGAVTHGLQFIRGSYGIFADADGASKFSDLSKLMSAIEAADNGEPHSIPAVAIGSRAHMVSTDAVVKRSFIRNFLMYGLHTLVFVFGIRTIRDTQCGFKLFNKAAIREIFPYMHTEGWIFDVEILILAIQKGISVSEVPISWHEVDGSKMDLARDSVLMAVDLVITRMSYIMGIYRYGSKNAKSE